MSALPPLPRPPGLVGPSPPGMPTPGMPPGPPGPGGPPRPPGPPGAGGPPQAQGHSGRFWKWCRTATGRFIGCIVVLLATSAIYPLIGIAILNSLHRFPFTAVTDSEDLRVAIAVGFLVFAGGYTAGYVAAQVVVGHALKRRIGGGFIGEFPLTALVSAFVPEVGIIVYPRSLPRIPFKPEHALAASFTGLGVFTAGLAFIALVYYAFGRPKSK